MMAQSIKANVMGDRDVARGAEVQDVPSAPQNIFATFHLWKVGITYTKASAELTIFAIVTNAIKFQELINNYQWLECISVMSLYSVA